MTRKERVRKVLGLSNGDRIRNRRNGWAAVATEEEKGENKGAKAHPTPSVCLVTDEPGMQAGQPSGEA